MLSNHQLQTGEQQQKFPTSIFENLLQNNELLEALFKPMNDENNSSNADLIVAQEIVLNDILGPKKLEEVDDKTKIYGNPFVGPNLWNKEELFSCDKLGLQFEFLDAEDFLAENDFNATDMSFLQNIDVPNETPTVAAPPAVVEVVAEQPAIVVTPPAMGNEIIIEDILMDIGSPLPSSSSTVSAVSSPAAKKPKTQKNRQNSSTDGSNSKFSFLDDELSQLTAEQLLEKVEHLMSDDEDLDYDDEYSKTSKKRNIPEELKDSKYWNRRRQNNLAAKRSRDARRLKESEVALKASFLERENLILKRQLDEYKQETKALKMRLARYERKNK